MTGPKRVTEKQLAANRANARASTGPRTPEGRARSRWNALKHGALAQAVIPAALEPFESRAAFEDLLGILRTELAPATAVEELLVERIATSYWRLARLLRAEAASVAQQLRSLPTERARIASVRGLLSLPSDADQLEAWAKSLAAAFGDERQLRALMARQDPRWQQANDDELVAGAAALLSDLRRESAEDAALQDALDRDMRSIPPLKYVLLFARYETTLERQIYRALDALERLQRRRAGEALPPPLRLSLDLDGDRPLSAGEG